MHRMISPYFQPIFQAAWHTCFQVGKHKTRLEQKHVWASEGLSWVSVGSGLFGGRNLLAVSCNFAMRASKSLIAFSIVSPSSLCQDQKNYVSS